MTNEPRARTRQRPTTAQAPEAATRDTVTLQWVAVGIAVVALLGAAVYFSDSSTGGGHGGTGAPAVEERGV